MVVMTHPNAFPGDITTEVDENGDVLITQDPQLDTIPPKLARWVLEQDHPASTGVKQEELFRQAALRGAQRAAEFLHNPDAVGADWPSVAIHKSYKAKSQTAENPLPVQQTQRPGYQTQAQRNARAHERRARRDRWGK